MSHFSIFSSKTVFYTINSINALIKIRGMSKKSDSNSCFDLSQKPYLTNIFEKLLYLLSIEKNVSQVCLILSINEKSYAIFYCIK